MRPRTLTLPSPFRERGDNFARNNLAESDIAMIRKLPSGKYRLYSRKKNPKTGRRRNLGTFASRAAARKSTSARCSISNGTKRARLCACRSC